MSTRKPIPLSALLILTACPSPDDTGTIGEFTVIDACDGQREFLDIPADADLLFTAGIYAQAPYPDGMDAPTEVYALDHDGGNPSQVVSYGGEGCEAYSDHYCLGLPVDPDFYPSGDRIAYSQLLSVEENSGSGRWNVFTASTTGLDQDVDNLTEHPTAYQDIVRVSERGLLFHEVDTAADPPYFGLVLTDQEGGSRRELINSQWNYYIGPGHWL